MEGTKTKEQVLELLERRRGESISGEELAQTLHISRSAVWKVIRELRQEGYQIQAVTNRGYCLSPETDILSAQGILAHLNGKWGLHVFQSVPSTNETAKKMAMDGAAHGTVVVADMQTAGRGRWGRVFYSPPGTGIYMSFIMRPPATLTMQDAALVTAAASVAVCGAIEAFTDRKAGIKWVNDIFVDGKKVSGILTEAVTDFETGSIDWIILGVGINFTTQEFPGELKDAAACICPEGGSRNAMIAQVIRQIAPLLDKQLFGDCLEEYRRRSLVVGREVTVHRGDTAYAALAEGIDGQGRLLIRKKDNTLERLSSGEVTICL